MSDTASSVKHAHRLSSSGTSAPASTALLTLPYPADLPSRLSYLAIAARKVFGGADLTATFNDPMARNALRLRLSARESRGQEGVVPVPPQAPTAPGLPKRQADDEQAEHDRYFRVARSTGSPVDGFTAGLALAQLVAYENCLDMGVTLLAEPEWNLLFAGLWALLRVAGEKPEAAGRPTECAPALPSAAGWLAGYDPGRRWLIGHQLFFALIQGAIVGMNCFAGAMLAGDTAEADEGLKLATAFMRSSAAAMKLTSDFAPDDYERTVRPAMAPPEVRAGFSGLQTRDHSYLVRMFGTLKPIFTTPRYPSQAHRDFIESVVSAYAAHEFICARFRGDVLPSLRMAAAARGKTQRPATAVIREMMRSRLALVDPSGDLAAP
jgi:hypothetical protein